MSTPKTAPTAQPETLGSAAQLTVLAVGIAVAITAGDPTILAGNLGKIVSSLNVTVDTASFIAGLATLTSAAATLGAGTLGDLFGSKRLFVIGLLGAITCDLVSMAAPSAVVLIAARAIMGVSFALLFGLALAIISSAVAPQKRAKAIGLFLGATALAHMPLPMIGDWLANTIGWRAMFSVSPVVALVSLPIAFRYMRESPRAEDRGVDVVGMLAAAVMLLGLVYGISQMQNRLTVRVIVPCLIGLIAGVLFIWWELRTPNPALDLRHLSISPVQRSRSSGCGDQFLDGRSRRRYQLLGHISERGTFYRCRADSHPGGRRPSRCVGNWGLADVEVYRSLNHDKRPGDYRRQLLGFGSARGRSIPGLRRGHGYRYSRSAGDLLRHLSPTS